MKDRLNQLLSSKGITPSQLADNLGVQRSNISHIMSGRNKPGFDFLVKLLEHYPDIDAEWLLLGKGSINKGHISEHRPENNLFSSTNEQPEIINNSPEISINKSNDTVSPPDIEQIIIFHKNKTFSKYLPS